MKVIAIAVIATVMLVALTLAAVARNPITAQTPSQLPAQEPPRINNALPVPPSTPAANSNLPTNVFQDDNHIVFTVNKNNEKLPPGPIIIVPPKEEGGNATIITPGENKTEGGLGNITVIKPDGNVTVIEDANITQPDNETVIIVPPDRNVTETPGNVTVIDPPRPTQLPASPQEEAAKPCTCNQTIPPVHVVPAPGQNVTTGQGPSQLPSTGNNNENNNTNTTKPMPPLIPQQLPVFGNNSNTNSNNTNKENLTATQLPATNFGK